MLRGIARLIKGCILLIVPMSLLAACGLLIAAGLHVGDEPDTLAVNVQITPDRIVAGQPFTLTVTVENQGENGVTIAGIGIDNDLLKGVDVQSSQPAYRGINGHNYPIYGKWQEYRLNKYMNTGDTLTVTFTLEGTQTGTYTGSLTVWIEDEVLGLFPLNRAWRDNIEISVY